MKKDIPSRTTLPIKESLFEKNSKLIVNINSIRAGDIKGEHMILFTNDDGEEIRFTHKASSRSVFVKGILKAAKILSDKPAGYYTLKDILGF